MPGSRVWRSATRARLRPLPAAVDRTPGTSVGRWLAVAGVANLLLAVGLVVWHANEPASPVGPPTRVEMSIPVEQQLILTGFNHPVALSPDGQRIAFVGRSGQGWQLYLKDQNEFTASPVDGTGGATFPFFSPDGESLGFFAGGELRRMSLSGGAPFAICVVSGGAYGAAWGPDDRIVFAVPEKGLSVVSANGGEPTALTELDESTDDGSHILPRFLPDGSGVLFTQLGPGEPNVALWSRDTGDWRRLIEGGRGAQWLSSGHLAYALRETLFVVPFDLSSGQATGSAAPIADGIYTSPFGVPYFTMSNSGTLAYVPARADDALVWVDRGGSETPATDVPGEYEHPRVSPADGRLIAVDYGSAGNRQIWILGPTPGTPEAVDHRGHELLAVVDPGWKAHRVRFAAHRQVGAVLEARRRLW